MKRTFIGSILMLINISAFAVSFSDIKVELQSYTQTYRLNQPIQILMNVVNTSQKPFTFYVSSLIYESFFFDVKTPKNEDIAINDLFQIQMKNNFSSSGDFRTIVLEPGESFSRTIDITEWFDIKSAGYYYIKGVFFPNPDDKSGRMESSYYKILVKPPLVIESEISTEEQIHNSELEEVQKYPPYQAIEDMFDAKMKKDWERFLVHIDARRLLLNAFPSFAADYNNARTGQYRLEVEDRFKKHLLTYWEDRILSYKFVKCIIEGENATVECNVEYKLRNLSYVMRYTFSMYQNHENKWLVYDYTTIKIQ